MKTAVKFVMCHLHKSGQGVCHGEIWQWQRGLPPIFDVFKSEGSSIPNVLNEGL